MASNVRLIPDGGRLIAAMLAARNAVRGRRDATAPGEAPCEEWWQVVMSDPRVRPRRRDWGDDLRERIPLGEYPNATIDVTCDKCDLRKTADREELIRINGREAPMPSPLHFVPDCPRAQAGKYSDWCGAKFDL